MVPGGDYVGIWDTWLVVGMVRFFKHILCKHTTILQAVAMGQLEFKENGNGSGNGKREWELAKIIDY